MPANQLLLVVAMVAALMVVIAGNLALIAWSLRRVRQGRALIVDKKGGEPRVSFTSTVVLPKLHSAEEIDLRLKMLPVEATGRHALISKDGAPVDVRALFYMRINRTPDDVLAAARAMGCGPAGDIGRIRERFTPAFLAAMKTVIAAFDARQLDEAHYTVKDAIIEKVGQDLGGFKLDDLVLEALDVRSKDGAEESR